MSEEMQWAKKLVSDKSFVLHTSTGVVGRVVRFWTGDEGDRINEQTKFPVLEMEAGHFLTALEEHFVPISEDESKFYKIAEMTLNFALEETIKLAASSRKVTIQSATVLVEAALQAQLRALQAKKR